MTGDSANGGNRDAVTVRSATASDIPAIVAIERQSSGASHWNAVEYERVLSSQLLLVAETGTAVVGFVCAKQVAAEWELENIAVAPAFHRHGIAGELLRLLLNYVRQSCASTVFLEVRESNLAAQRFYEKHGFVEVGRRRRYYQSPDEDAVLYRLGLKPPAQSPEPKA